MSHLETCEQCRSTILVEDGDKGMQGSEHFTGCSWYGPDDRAYLTCSGCEAKPPIVCIEYSLPVDAEEAPRRG